MVELCVLFSFKQIFINEIEQIFVIGMDTAWRHAFCIVILEKCLILNLLSENVKNKLKGWKLNFHHFPKKVQKKSRVDVTRTTN